jgi:hypothetical protein
MNKRVELISFLGWAIVSVVFAAYAALMLNRSAATFKEYRDIALGNHALMLKHQQTMLENQRLFNENQKLFKQHMKSDQQVHLQLETLNKRLRPTAPL